MKLFEMIFKDTYFCNVIPLLNIVNLKVFYITGNSDK